MGRQLIATYQSYRRIAIRLSTAGFSVLRFDYRTTGDSSGDLDRPNCVRAWLDSIGQAVDFVREVGNERVVLVGMRLGGNLAARAISEGVKGDGLVLWDPYATGRRFLREEQALYRLTLGSPRPGDMAETPGFVYRSDVGDDLGGCDVATLRPWDHLPTHLILREDRPNSKLADSARLGKASIEIAPKGIDLMDVLNAGAGVPLPGEREVVRWVGHLDGGRSPVHLAGSSHARIAVEGATQPVIERPVHLGRSELFGIRTDPVHPGLGPTVVFLNVSDEHHIGPARQWVEISRRLAATGVSCVRVDLSGLGDSPARPGQPDNLVYAPGAISDVHALVEEIGDGDPKSVVVVGLCSGAYTAIEAATNLQLGGVCAINPVLDMRYFIEQEEAPIRPRAIIPKRRWWSQLGDSAVGAKLALRAPPGLWWLLDFTWVQRSPARGLLPVVQRSIPTLVLCGDLEGYPALERRGGWLLRRMSRRGPFCFEVISGLDHAAVVGEARTQLADVLFRHLRGLGTQPPERGDVGVVLSGYVGGDDLRSHSRRAQRRHRTRSSDLLTSH